MNHKIPSQPKLVVFDFWKEDFNVIFSSCGPRSIWGIVISIHSSLSFNISICFSQTTDQVGTKLIRNVTRWFSTYYLIFISLDNPIWLLDPIILLLAAIWKIFSKTTCVMELQHMSFCRSWRSIVSFWNDSKSKMAIITSDWTMHFLLLL